MWKYLISLLIFWSSLSTATRVSTFPYPGSQNDNTYLGRLVKHGCVKNPVNFDSGLFTENEIKFLNKFNPYQRLHSHTTTGSIYTSETEGLSDRSRVHKVRLGSCQAKIKSSEIELPQTKPIKFKSASIAPICETSSKVKNSCDEWFESTKEDFKRQLIHNDQSKRPIAMTLNASTEPIRDLTFVRMRNKHCKRNNGIFRKLKLCREIKKNEKCFRDFLRSKASSRCKLKISNLKEKYLVRLRKKRAAVLEKEFVKRLEKENKQRESKGLPPSYVFLKTPAQVSKRKKEAKKIIEYTATKRRMAGELKDKIPSAPSNTQHLIDKLDKCVKSQGVDLEELGDRFKSLRVQTGGIPEIDEDVALRSCEAQFPSKGVNDPRCSNLFKSIYISNKIASDNTCFSGSVEHQFMANDPLVKYVYSNIVVNETRQLPIMQGEAFIFPKKRDYNADSGSSIRSASMSLKRLPLEDITLRPSESLFIEQSISSGEEVSCNFRKNESVPQGDLSGEESVVLDQLRKKLSSSDLYQATSSYQTSPDGSSNVGEYSFLSNTSAEMKRRCARFRNQNVSQKHLKEKMAVESHIAMDFIESQFSENNQSNCEFEGDNKSTKLNVKKGTFGNIQISITLPKFQGNKFKSISCDNENSNKSSVDNQEKIARFDLYNPRSWRSTVLGLPQDQELLCKCNNFSGTTKQCSLNDVLTTVAKFYQTPFGKKVVEASRIAESGVTDESLFKDQMVEGGLQNLEAIVDKVNGCEQKRREFKRRYEGLSEASRRFLNPDIEVPLLDSDGDVSENQ